MAVSVPPIPDTQIGNLPTLLFGPGAHQQDRYDDPEVQGGRIALIAVKQLRVQKPPNFLDRMQSTFLKQVAYNQRIMKAEEEISGINCDVADFVSKMTLDRAEEVIICVNGSQEMKRGESTMAGQLWIQGDRMMTASNRAFDGMSNTKKSAVLSATAEAIAWKNDALETPGPRKSQRVVIYPKELSQLDAVLASGDPNVDPEDGHPIAYQRVLAAASEFEIPPIFLKEDCEAIVSDPKKAEVVPRWMCMAERIATGSRPRVLEDGPDTIHSDDEAKKDVEPDEELDMYAPGVDPKLGPTKLSKKEVARQLAAAQILKAQASGSRFQSSCSESDNPDGFDMRHSHTRHTFVKNAAKDLSDSDVGNSIISSPVPSEAEDHEGSVPDHQKMIEDAKRRTSIPRSPSAGNLVTPKKGKPASRSRAEAGPQSGKKASPGTADVPQPTEEQQAPKQPVKGQESPGTKVPTPTMVTRSQASRARGLRSGGGSGQPDTCVANGNPSKT
jgi:hypothetical protein